MPLSIVRGEAKGVYIVTCAGDIGMNGECDELSRVISSYAARGRKTQLLLVLTDARFPGEQAKAALSYGCVRVKECGGVVKILNPPDYIKTSQMLAWVKCFDNMDEAMESFK